MNRKEKRINERKMKKFNKKDAALIEFGKENVVYESDIYPPEFMKIASEVRQELARENPNAYLNLVKMLSESDESRVLPKSWMQNILDSKQVSI